MEKSPLSLRSLLRSNMDGILNCSSACDSNTCSITESEPSIYADNSDDPDYIPPVVTVVANTDHQNCALNQPLSVTSTCGTLPTSVDPVPSTSNIEEILQPRSVLNTDNPARKKKRDPSSWKREVFKRKRQQGKEYRTVSGKLVPARKMKDIKCGNDCANSCSLYFPTEQRQQIYDHFWTLNDEEKKIFFAKSVVRYGIKRKRVLHEHSRKQNTFKYSLECEKQSYQVCQSFFLATISITQRVIYYFYKHNYNSNTGLPIKSTKGKHVKTKIPDSVRMSIRAHIESFPVVDPHYSRANSRKQYLESGLSVRKMFNMFKETSNYDVKYSFYREIYNSEHNLSFFIPKKDQCDLCLKFHSQVNHSTAETQKFENHRKCNESAKMQKEVDKKYINNEVAVVCYDLQNVFQLPRGFAGNFYYKKKFATYNLTAHCNLNNVTYCALWYETQAGRSGNDIASALLKILNAIREDHPQIKHIVLWSDSCIPQNKNRITSLALLKFLEKNNTILTIVHRYSEAGHSRVQEVDAVHSEIDRHLKHISYCSPLSLLRNLKNMNYPKLKIKLIQLTGDDIYNFNAASLGLNLTSVKYKYAKGIKYTHDLKNIQYKTEHGALAEAIFVPVFKPFSVRNKSHSFPLLTLPIVQKCKLTTPLSKEKVNDIKSMMDFMPAEDVEFYKAVLKI